MGWSTVRHKLLTFISFCCTVAQSCLTLCDHMDCSKPGFPVHPLVELAQTHAHWVDDAIQPSLPQSTLSPPAFKSFPIPGSFPMSSLFALGGGSDGKESACNVRDLSSIPELGRSSGGGYGNTFQYSCLENPQGQRSLVGYSPWGCKESDMTEWLHFFFFFRYPGDTSLMAESEEELKSLFTRAKEESEKAGL